MSNVKSRPILFSAPMVQAILGGKKTQTRRILKPQIEPHCWEMIPGYELKHSIPPGANFAAFHHTIPQNERWDTVYITCPYGRIGDQLWLRETYFQFGHWEEVPGVKTKTGRMKWRFVPDSEEIVFDAPDGYRKSRHHKDPSTPAWHKRLGRFMPRRYSRITLEITDIRVERLQDISEEDAKAEGINAWTKDNGQLFKYWAGDFIDGPFRRPWSELPYTAVGAFQALWTSINGPGSWEENPWVFVVEFRRIEQP